MAVQNIISIFWKSLVYPPTEDQLRLLRFFGNNIWFLRILSLVVLLLALYFWHRLVLKITTNKLISLLSCLFIFLMPSFYVLWLCFPFDCLKLLIIIGLVYYLRNKTKILLVLGSIFLILFCFGITSERSSFVHKLSLSDASKETGLRFAAEDSLTDAVAIPLKLKRVVYNKYFIEYKETINEVVPFFDMESLFFQEIHPLEQKSVVMFVWPEIFLFIGGIYLLVKEKNKKSTSLVLVLFGLALVSFLFDPNNVFRKFELAWWPISLIMAMAAMEVFRTKIIFGKVIGLIFLFLSGYGIVANHIDLNKRPDYWLNNRPYFYKFVFESIKNRDWQSFDQIQVTTLVGSAEKYCSYYLGDCDNSKFVFESFELEESRPEKNSIYAGFAGEFVGSDFKNNINKDWLVLVKDKGFTNIETANLRDTIAYKFGNDVIVGEVK